MFRFAVASLLALPLLASCLVDVENQIEADAEIDKRLVGVWVCVPIYEDPEERKEMEEKAYKAGIHREVDDVGINGYLVIGDSGEGTLELLGIENFDSDSSGPLILKGRRGRTRSHEGRSFLLFNLEGEGQEEDPVAVKRFVLEYRVEEDGSLRLWYLYVDTLEEVLAAHPMGLEQDQESIFGGATVKGTPEEILAFYSNPEVSKRFVSAGRYKKLEVPANARVRWEPEN